MLPDLEYAILSVLRDEPEKGYHGIGVIDAVKKKSDGEWVISAGSLYPTLNRLATKEFITSAWGDPSENTGGARRKYYKITAKGNTAYEEAWKTYSKLNEPPRKSGELSPGAGWVSQCLVIYMHFKECVLETAIVRKHKFSEEPSYVDAL